MFNMNIKPRLAHIESGAIVEDMITRNRGFVAWNSNERLQVITVFEDGRMLINEQEYKEDDKAKFFSSYKMIAQRNEYDARMEGVTNDKSI